MLISSTFLEYTSSHNGPTLETRNVALHLKTRISVTYTLVNRFVQNFQHR